MSQEQLQIFYAAFKPRLRSPKNKRQKELDELLRREGNGLEATKNRIERMQRDEKVDYLSAAQGQTLLDQIR